MKFYEKLQNIRQNAKMTQAELGEKLGVSKRTIINYESGKIYPRHRDIYKKLAEIFNVPSDYFLSESEEFIATATEQYGSRGASQAKNIIEQTNAMFAGGDLSDEEQLEFIHIIQGLYLDSKKKAKKYTPKKYLK